jgi:hypothetical protein
LIGCGVLIVLFGVGAVGLTLKANEILVWVLRKMEDKIAGKLPADLTAEERKQFETAFEDLYASVGQGKIDPVAVQSLQRELLTISGQVESGLSREQVLRLTAAVEAAAGKARPDADEGTGERGSPAATPAAAPAASSAP